MSKYTPPQVEKMLSSMTVLYDTREQDTEALRTRLEGLQCPSERRKLDYGDYTAMWYENSVEATLERVAVVERKYAIDELCTCFTTGRARFKRELERAKTDGCRIHLLVENGNYEKIFAHKYKSKLLPQSLIASIMSWQARCDMRLHFCRTETTGRLIAEILRYELRQWLLNK